MNDSAKSENYWISKRYLNGRYYRKFYEVKCVLSVISQWRRNGFTGEKSVCDIFTRNLVLSKISGKRTVKQKTKKEKAILWRILQRLYPPLVPNPPLCQLPIPSYHNLWTNAMRQYEKFQKKNSILALLV